MAQRYVTDAGVLTVPGAYVQTKVQTNNSGISTTGVIVLVGEAEAGPDFSAETDITQAWFGPDQLSAVIKKYSSGNLVDGFRAAAQAANDPNVQGAPSRIYLVKTNQGSRSQAALVRSGLANYGVLADRQYGKIGESMYFTVSAAQDEQAASTGRFTWIPSPSGATLKTRVNGGAVASSVLTALVRPVTAVGAITSGSATGLHALAPNVIPLGGVDRAVLTGITATSNLAVTVNGNSITVTLSGVATSWATIPSIGDTLMIPQATGQYGATAGSVIKGAGNENGGAYVVTAATATTITATKLRNYAAGALTAPVAVGAVAISATPTNDLVVCAPVELRVLAGTARNMLVAGNVGATLTGTLSGGQLTLTLSTGAWGAQPQVGDTIYVPSTAPADIANSMGGFSRVVASTSNTVTVERISDDRAHVAFVATAIAAVADVQAFRPAVDGLQKSLEAFDGGGTDNVSSMFYNLSATAVSWLSTSAVPYVLRSVADARVQVQIQRASDGVNETVPAVGGEVALRVGYKGTTGSVTINATTISSTVTGGLGANFSFTLANFRTIGDLAAKINSLTGYKAEIPNGNLSQLPCSALDQGTYSICSDFAGIAPGAIKRDAYAFFKALQANSAKAQLGYQTAAQATAGLPEPQAQTYLAGGAKGATTAANFAAALVVVERIRCNFVVPLFSRDASADIADSLTDPSSTYTIAGVNAALLSHVLKMSTLQRRRPRLGAASIRDTFSNAKSAAGSIASARVIMHFQDVKALGGEGNVVQYQPWYASCLAAGMQAAGFYRAILGKGVNCSGVVQAAGDFVESDDSYLAAALEAGLNPMKPREEGGFEFVSDQTTYTADENFVFNSFQAMYVADTIAMTLAQRLEKAFKGQSFADVSAAVVLSFVKNVVADLKRLKLVAASDEAPAGFDNLVVTIAPPAIVVELSVVEATAVYFIPVMAAIQQVRQTAA